MLTEEMFPLSDSQIHLFSLKGLLTTFGIAGHAVSFFIYFFIFLLKIKMEL